MLRKDNTHLTNESISVYKNYYASVYVCPITTVFHEDLLLDDERNTPHKKQQFFQSRRLLRTLLKDNNLNHNINILKDTKGKPILENCHDLNISISHTRKHVAVGLSRDFKIGIDLENIKDRKYLKKIACKVFNENENYNLSLCSNYAEYINLFFRYWTKREALGKAYGIGLIFASNDKDYPESNHIIEWHSQAEYLLCVSILQT